MSCIFNKITVSIIPILLVDIFIKTCLGLDLLNPGSIHCVNHKPEEYSLVAKAVSKVLLVKKALDHLLTESFHKNRFHFLEFLTKGAESKIAPPRPELSKFVCQTNLLRTGGFLDCGIAKKGRVTNKRGIINALF